MNKTIFTVVLAIILAFVLYAQDESIDKDTALANLMVRAKSGDASSQFELGYKYYKGIDFQADTLEALYWFQLSSDQDYTDAMAMLGQMYKNGDGVEKSYKTALSILKKAAAQNNARAQYQLGIMYYAGMGVKASNKQATKYFRLASDQGNCEAQSNLGTCYFEGTYVPTDYSESYFWYSLAYELCPPEKHELYFYNKEKARLELSMEKQEEVNIRVREWLDAYTTKN